MEKDPKKNRAFESASPSDVSESQNNNNICCSSGNNSSNNNKNREAPGSSKATEDRKSVSNEAFEATDLSSTSPASVDWLSALENTITHLITTLNKNV